MSKKIVSPNQIGGKGIPPGLSKNGGGRKGFVIPSEVGKKGKPGKAGFPSRKAPLD